MVATVIYVHYYVTDSYKMFVYEQLHDYNHFGSVINVSLMNITQSSSSRGLIEHEWE